MAQGYTQKMLRTCQGPTTIGRKGQAQEGASSDVQTGPLPNLPVSVRDPHCSPRFPGLKSQNRRGKDLQDLDLEKKLETKLDEEMETQRGEGI